MADAMTPPAPTPGEEAAQRIDAVRGMVGEMRSGENWTLNRDAIMALLADHDLLLATARARGREADGQLLTCLLTPLEILAATECDDAAIALNSALKRMILNAVTVGRDAIRATALEAENERLRAERDGLPCRAHATYEPEPETPGERASQWDDGHFTFTDPTYEPEPPTPGEGERR